MRELILLRRKYLLEDVLSAENQEKSKYYAAKLLNTFGVLVDYPQSVTKEHVELISKFYSKTVPDSFYKNPQDTKYFSGKELLIEQLISYMSIEYITGVDSEDKDSFRRIEVFKKALPDYEEGKEVVFRHYKIINDLKAKEILEDIAKDLSSYTRKWNETEEDEFKWLYLNGYWNSAYAIKSKDNVITIFNKYPRPDFAKFLDKKDVVKLSIEMIGETSSVKYNADQRLILEVAIKNCRDTALTKKQAKFYNTICKKLGLKGLLGANNFNSPYRLAKQHIAVGDIIGAAKVFARNGSLLERNLVWLLSRANLKESEKILDMIKVKNPLVAIQFLNGLLDSTNGPRIFKFHHKGLIKVHRETDKEAMYRKSILSPGVKRLLKETFDRKIDDYYRSLPSLGNVYIDPAFEKVGLPLNTSASGTGLDVPPTGSRVPLTEDYIRAFTYWNGPLDVDTNVSFIHESGKVDLLFWGNYAGKSFGDSALCSGDDRSSNGAEYSDFKISELLELGYKYAIYTLNGYGSKLNIGEIYTGYQNKKDLNTKAWQPNNIAMKFQVKGDTRNYLAFAIDLESRELIVINQLMESKSRVINKNDFGPATHLLDERYLEQFNVARIARCRGEVVDSPLLADYVFMNDYKPSDFDGEDMQANQTVIRTSDTEKIVALLNK